MLTGAAAAGLVLTGCAALSPRQIEISEARLLEAFSQRFPLNLRLLDSIDVLAVSPRLKLLPERNRLATEIDVSAGRGLLGRALQGTIGLTYGLRFETSDATVRLDQVQVERIELAGVQGMQQGPGGRLAAALAEEMLRDFVVYRLKPAEAALLQHAGFKPQLRVRPGGLSIALQPPR